jgi:MarR family transcriptional regulator, organic hydroperoxide resistance regulator
MVSASLKRARHGPISDRKRSAGATGTNGRRATPLARLAGEVWEAMFQAVMARKEHLAAVAGKFGMTLAQAHLLRLVQFGPARTMTSLAEALACDASNITGIVDRLESRGLIMRGNASHDRRIKSIFLTPRGNAVVGQLTAAFLEPPPELRHLSDTQLKKLHELLRLAFVHVPGQLRSPSARPGSRASRA